MYEKKHALPNKKIHTPKGIARLTVTAATMAAMTGSSLISPFTAFAQTGDGGTQHPAVMSPIAAHAGADTAKPGSLAQTGDRAGLIGETFVIGGTVLVAAGVFLDQKKRREQM